MTKYPTADAVTEIGQKGKSVEIVEARQLVGAANNTKWNKLLNEMRQREDWRPSYRYKSVGGYVSGWDTEWFYHLPFPFVGVEWFDIGMHQSVPQGALLDDRIIDHSTWILPLLDRIGFEHEWRQDVVRIWGYLPRAYDDFPPTE